MMTPITADSNRFQPHREPLVATIARTFGIAIAIATVATLSRAGHVPANSTEWRLWLAIALPVLWISFGGHWVELIYLNGIRPVVAHWSDPKLVLARLMVWMIGGTILVPAAVATGSLLATGHWPTAGRMLEALAIGGPVFVVIELVPHTFLQLSGRPSFWNGRG